MKRKITKVLCFALVFSILFGMNSFAVDKKDKKDKVKLLKVEKVKLDEDENSKVYELKTMLDNGIIVYDMGVIDKKDHKKAFEYMIKVTGDSSVKRTVGTNLGTPGEYYNSDFQNDSRSYDAVSNTWERLIISGAISIHSYGGQAASWSGVEVPNMIVLNQSAQFNGIGINVSWPPEMTGSSTSRSWQSQPFTGTKLVGASHSTLDAWCIGFTSISYTDSGDIYLPSQIYRPTTNCTFSGFY